MPKDDTPSDDEDGITTTTKSRWEWLTTVLALTLIPSVPAIIIYVLVTGATLSPVTQAWFGLYALVVLTATVWAFGKGPASKALDMLGPSK